MICYFSRCFALRVALGAALLLAMPLDAMAQAQRLSPIRAVEHPEYSRLVIPLADGVAYELNQQGASAELRLVGPGPALDTASIFERMPRTRLLAADAKGPDADGIRRLHLTLGCSCRVTAEPLGSRFLAVDVRRVSGAQATEVAVAQLAEPNAAGGSSANAQSDGGGADATLAEALDAPQASDDLESSVENGFAGGRILQPLRTLPQIGDDVPDNVGRSERDVVVKEPGEGAGATAAVTQDDLVITARESLIRELARAAEEGILSLAPEAETEMDAALAEGDVNVEDEVPALPDETVPPRRAGLSAELDTPAVPPSDAELSAGLTPHLTVRGPSNAYPDLLTASDEAPRPVCVGDAALDVRMWSLHVGSFSDRLGELRRTLIDQSGQIDVASVENLARHYIASGFGREASVILHKMGTGGSNQILLKDLANLVEGRPGAEDGPVAGSVAAECVGRVTLWRAVGGLDTVDFETDAGIEIVRGLEELPPLLRRQLGQAIARHAILDGAPDTARRIIGILDRTPGQPDSGEIRVRASLALAEGQAAEAVALLGPNAVDRASPDPESLAIYAKAVLAEDRYVDVDLSTTLASVAAPLPASTDVGLALRLLKARVDAAVGAPLEALSELRDLASEEGARKTEIIQAARKILTDFDPLGRPPDLAARVIMENQEFLGVDRESAALRHTYAQALLKAGLPQGALRVLAVDDQLPTADMRLLAGAAHLRLGAPDKALLVLEPVAGEAAARLKAEAHVRRGDFTAGFEALESLGLGDPERQRLAILARRWDALGEPEVPGTYDALARYAQTESNRGTIGLEEKESAMTRDVAEAALEDARGLQLTLDALPLNEADQ